MQTLLADYLPKITLGTAQPVKNLVVYPIFQRANHAPDYLTLTEAFQQNLVTITEVGLGGSVPQLKVTNKSERLLLLVEGEELIGARQNRTLNTSLLLRGNSETIVPVSCTEKGRWTYKSAAFSESNFISPHKLRRVKSNSVSQSLKSKSGFSSNQQAVWHCVDGLCASSQVHSSTSAMSDVMTKMNRELEEYLQQLPAVAEQNGLLVVINGEVVGLDIISSPRAYQILHPKFMRSYATDAVLQTKPAGTETSNDKVQTFLEASKTSNEQSHPSISFGEDRRYDGPDVAGAALLAESQVVHLNLYRK